MNFGACPFPNPWSRSIANSGQLTWPKNHAWYREALQRWPTFQRFVKHNKLCRLAES
jgi:hypothetical protein